jgi:cytidylate kinase
MTQPTHDPVAVITIDGPGGAGKGTVSMRVAEALGWHILDSGSLYRLTALRALNDNVKDESRIAEIALQLDVMYRPQAQQLQILLDAEDVTDAIRTEKVGSMASVVAAMPGVRDALLERQRAFARAPGLVADGRDMGTVVFPSAALKIFLTASPEERANRRHKQLKDKGIDANLPDLIAELKLRDERDTHRSTAPLKAATDAILIDTTTMDIDTVVNRVLQLARERFNNGGL